MKLLSCLNLFRIPLEKSILCILIRITFTLFVANAGHPIQLWLIYPQGVCHSHGHTQFAVLLEVAMQVLPLFMFYRTFRFGLANILSPSTPRARCTCTPKNLVPETVRTTDYNSNWSKLDQGTTCSAPFQLVVCVLFHTLPLLTHLFFTKVVHRSVKKLTRRVFSTIPLHPEPSYFNHFNSCPFLTREPPFISFY